MPRVVFVHGAGGGGWEWAVWQRVFAARGLRVCALDLIPAPAGLAATSFADYRAQVLRWCLPERSQDLAPILLVGASLAGLLAMAVAAEVEAGTLLLVNPLQPDGLIGKGRGETHPALIPWGRERSLADTSRAMPHACSPGGVGVTSRVWRWGRRRRVSRSSYRLARSWSWLAMGMRAFQRRSAGNSPHDSEPTTDACRTAAMLVPCLAGRLPVLPNGLIDSISP